VQQDANFNVTAVVKVVSGTTTVMERYVYDPYGKVTYLNATWSTLTGSAYSWNYLFQGARLDPTSNLYGLRHRDDSATLGRWTTVDPIGFKAGDVNPYRFVINAPLNATDPSGLVFFIPLLIAGAALLIIGAGAAHVASNSIKPDYSNAEVITTWLKFSSAACYVGFTLATIGAIGSLFEGTGQKPPDEQTQQQLKEQLDQQQLKEQLERAQENQRQAMMEKEHFQEVQQQQGNNDFLQQRLDFIQGQIDRLEKEIQGIWNQLNPPGR
jgi:RHS repeat-associated protein